MYVISPNRLWFMFQVQVHMLRQTWSHTGLSINGITLIINYYRYIVRMYSIGRIFSCYSSVNNHIRCRYSGRYRTIYRLISFSCKVLAILSVPSGARMSKCLILWQNYIHIVIIEHIIELSRRSFIQNNIFSENKWEYLTIYLYFQFCPVFTVQR